MDPVSVPIRVTWSSMMAAKLGAALAPGRLAVFLVATAMLAVGVSVLTHAGVVTTLAWMVPALVGLRLAVMSLSAALDSRAVRRFTGTLTFSPAGLTLERADGSREDLAWTWILAASERAGVISLRVAERGGRATIFLAHPDRLPALRALLVEHGKLR